MTPTLKTERLTLRPPLPTDATPITAALQNPNVHFWLTAVTQPYDFQDAENFLISCTHASANLHWVLDEGGGLIGLISIGSELGYWLRTEDHGRGLMTEAATAVVTDYFTYADDPLVSGYHLGNDASCNVLKKLGFVNTHIDAPIKSATGQPVPTQRMVLTKSLWNAR
ncbi:Protein N-acetyltransferase, RimJ/RimL family [Cognatiyoonia koreensis]|uniref:Protein N-acetyltransferase, RimJ/RimL family n=1 Tax=Cognatiyoonia koreensis TaxID=364200 RepID=A0A1I0PCN8_9RHOB|nr:GNAT family N-acetyltransferase [Cognatiyoonia koreensis]SEW11370.1 Protein N-acetyltransferase, RimJ/RimL family [Cognatiyoonia koreensis]